VDPQLIPSVFGAKAMASTGTRDEANFRKVGDWAGQKTARLRGRAGMAQRQRRLAAEPLCRHCAEQGKTTASVTPDHIVPLGKGGTDHDDNIQCLCEPCHDAKTALDMAGMFSNAMGVDADGWPTDPRHQANGGTGKLSKEYAERRMPTDLKPSRIPLTILCGPPASGKSSHLREHQGPNDLVIDLDAIMAGLSGRREHQTSKEWLTPALDHRNALLRSLHTDTTHDAAWFIISAPDPLERAQWAKMLKARVIVLDTPLAECARRIKADPTRKGQEGRMLKAAADWWRVNAR